MNRYLAVMGLLAFLLPGDVRGVSQSNGGALMAGRPAEVGSATAMATPHNTGSISFPSPEPTRGMEIGPADRVQSLSYEQWRAIADAFPESEEWTATRVMMCESGGDPSLAIIDANGEWSIGAFMVQPRWHGAVPRDIAGQAKQAAAIVARYGWTPWQATASGCARFTR